MFEAASRIASCGAGVMRGCRTRVDTHDERSVMGNRRRMMFLLSVESPGGRVKLSEIEKKKEEKIQGRWES